MPICGLEYTSAQVTQFLYLLRWEECLALFGIGDKREVGRQLVHKPGVHQTQSLAMLVALVRVEEHQHALVAKVPLAKAMLVQTVDLRVSQHVTHTLQVYYHHVALGQLPREVAQTLSNQALVGILSRSVGPPSIVIVLVVLAIDEVFTIVVLEACALVKDLVDERVHEFDHVARVDYADHLIVEFIHDVLADEHGLDVVLHLLGIVSYRVHILRDLDNISLLEILI